MPYAARPRLADPDAEKWYRAMARKSRITADVNYRRLRAFCEQMGVDPAGILKRARRQTDIRDLLDRFVEQEAEKKRAAWYIHSSVIAVKSWLRFNDRPLRLQVELPSNTVSARREDERVPTREELRSVLLAAKPHERAVVVLMAHAGLRPGAIGSYLGDDGLRMKDLPDLHYSGDGCRAPKAELHEPGRFVFGKIPARVRVRPSSSKAKHQYLTFLGEEPCGYLAQYLEQRAAQGETVGPESSVAHPRYSDKQFVRALNISARIRRLFKSAGLTDTKGRTPRPYVLRQYFLNRCLEAQSQTGVPDRFVEFWAGHKGDVTAQSYTTGLPNLPESLLEEMRTSYHKCEPFLSTITAPANDGGGDRILRALLITAGRSEEEVRKLDLGAMSDAEIVALVRKATGAAAPGPRERVVSKSEVPALLEQGWVSKGEFYASRWIVERA